MFKPTDMTCTINYRDHFWDEMLGQGRNTAALEPGRDIRTGAYSFPESDGEKMDSAIRKEGLLRNLATVVTAYKDSGTILAGENDDVAVWVPENGEIPLRDGMNDFTRHAVGSRKLAVLVRLTNEFIQDAAFDFEGYLTGRLAKNFARAEDDAFINGNGKDAPTGLLHPEKGAETGAGTDALSYDDVVKLYFSVKPEYRRNGTFLMNDETALALRTMKDKDGNYLWSHSTDTILGKPVKISEYMPNPEPGKTPVLFGDFSYYWIVLRSPVSVRTLKEKFVSMDQTGYLAFEFLDGRLVRRDAVKGLAINGAE